MEHNKFKRIISLLSGIFIIGFFAFVIITSIKEKNVPEENAEQGAKNNVSAADNIDVEESDRTDYEEYFKNFTGELTYIEKPKFQYDVNNKVPSEDFPYGYTQEEKDFSSYISYKETANNYMYKNESWKDYPLSKDKVFKVGDKILMYDRMEYITVNSIKYYDNADELKKDDFFDKSDLAFKSGSDGNFRQIYSQEDGSEGNLKLAVLNITIESNHPWVSALLISDLFCVGMMKEEDDGYHIVNTENHYYFLDKNGDQL